MVARLKDVAQLAGVSVKTASNVVNDYPHISPATRTRVQAAIRELRYRPNLSARQLKAGRAGFLTLAVPELETPYFAELASRFTEAATRLGYMLLIEVTGADPAVEQGLLDGMRRHAVDGIIFSPLTVSPDQIRARVDSVPMVLLGEHTVPDCYDHVAVDSVAACFAMTQHLLVRGRTRIAAIGQQPREGTGSVRLQGYRKALEDHGLQYNPDLVVDVARYGRADGRIAMQGLLALPEPPDAVFCFNDLLALGAIRACIDADVAVPGQVAIAGFDDIQEGQFSNPTLTTISTDLQELAAEALRLLLSRLSDEHRPPVSVTVPWSLLTRESTATAPATRNRSGDSHRLPDDQAIARNRGDDVTLLSQEAYSC
jgi:DNA-binding LacI/PurR family transcriptional regulator